MSVPGGGRPSGSPTLPLKTLLGQCRWETAIKMRRGFVPRPGLAALPSSERTPAGLRQVLSSSSCLLILLRLVLSWIFSQGPVLGYQEDAEDLCTTWSGSCRSQPLLKERAGFLGRRPRLRQLRSTSRVYLEGKSLTAFAARAPKLSRRESL